MKDKKSKSSLIEKGAVQLNASNSSVELAFDVPVTKEMEACIVLGNELRKSANGVMELYRGFVQILHTFLPKEQTAICLKAGFDKFQASRFKAVTSLPPTNFKEYVEGKLAWRPALDRAREERAARTGTARKVNYIARVIAQAAKVKHKLVGVHIAPDTHSFALVMANRSGCKMGVEPNLSKSTDMKAILVLSLTPSMDSKEFDFGDVVVRYAVEKKTK